MARIKEYREVINNSDKEYTEEFRGEKIVLPPRGSIVMERRAAVQLLAQYAPFDREKSEGVKPLSWKPAKGRVPAAPEPQVEIEPKFKNEANGKTFDTKEELDADLKGFEHMSGTLRLKKDED